MRLRVRPPLMIPDSTVDFGRQLGSVDIARNEVHLWYANPEAIDVPSLLDAYVSLVSQDERVRHQRFRVDQRRRDFLVGKVLVRTVLARYLRVSPRELEFARNPYGRPELVRTKDIPPLRFSLSYTKGLVVCAVAHMRDIGVDAENLGRDLIGRELASVLSENEQEVLRDLDEDAWKERFLSLWVLKESYAKATGMGLSIPLKLFTVRLPGSPGAAAISFHSTLRDDPKRWRMTLVRLTSAHIVALAMRCRPGETLAVRTRHTVPLVF
jgi:4'-phosphopantetheinyl transferase